jgi:hypothetical protein
LRKLKYNTEEFISKCKSVHGDVYSYDILVFRGVKSNVLVTCGIHGDFEIRGSSHLKGRGCSKCFAERRGEGRRLSQKEWVDRANKVHNNYYDYSLVDYKNQRQRLTIVCPRHGEFTAIAGVHVLGGAYCHECRTRPPGTPRSTQEEFIDKVKLVHDNKYDYSETVYTKLPDKIVVICKEHGRFEIIANNHANGRGCQSCAKYGFKMHKPASLYILEADNIVKIGITNRKVKERVCKIRRDCEHNFKIFSEFKFDLGKDAIRIETILLNELAETHAQPVEVFDGSTECFIDLDKSYLIKRIGELISEINKEQNSSKQASQEA